MRLGFDVIKADEVSSELSLELSEVRRQILYVADGIGQTVDWLKITDSDDVLDALEVEESIVGELHMSNDGSVCLSQENSRDSWLDFVEAASIGGIVVEESEDLSE